MSQTTWSHSRLCVDDDGHVDCVCRWAREDRPAWPRASGWASEFPRRLFRCEAGHLISSDLEVVTCLRMNQYQQACLQPVTEVTE